VSTHRRAGHVVIAAAAVAATTTAFGVWGSTSRRCLMLSGRMLHRSDVEMEQTFTQVSARPFGPSLEVRLYERNLAIDSEGRTCAAPVSFVHGEAGLKSLTNPVDQQCIDRRPTTIH
jgi:hypothetical protein